METSTPPKPTKRRKWPWWTLGLLVFTSGILAILAYRGYFEYKNGFSKETAGILRQLTGGAESSGHAYDNASFSLRKTINIDSFVDRADRMTKTLGVFKAIDDIETIETIHTILGKTTRVEYQLRFEHGSTWGEFSYLRNAKGKNQLLGFEVNIPDNLAIKGQEVDAEADRISAPDKLIRQMDDILSAISAGKASEVRAAAAKPFQDSTSEESFNQLASTLDAKLGAFEKRVKIHSSEQNVDKNRAHLELLLQYEKAKTTGNFDFIRKDSEWLLLRFKVVIPEPLLPQRE